MTTRAYVDACDLEVGTEIEYLGNIVKVATVKEVESTSEFPSDSSYWMEVVAADGFEYRFAPYMQLPLV